MIRVVELEGGRCSGYIIDRVTGLEFWRTIYSRGNYMSSALTVTCRGLVFCDIVVLHNVENKDDRGV